MNVMLTCAGRRSHTVEIFQHALRGRGEVYACDSSADAPALRVADQAFVVPAVSEPGYADALLELCAAHRVGLLIPALEPELPLLAAQRARFSAVGTRALVSSPEVIATCYDKLATAAFLTQHGLQVPKTFVSLDEARQAVRCGELSYPLVVKPRWGVSSIGVDFAEDDEELELAFRLARKRLARSVLAAISATDPEHCVLIQERLAGSEYGLDIVNDLDGRHVTTFIKRKLRMRAGQTDRAVTVRDEPLERLGRVIGRSLRHVGLLDCDVFVTAKGGYAVDLNPRIGGGYPFSHLAGADFPAALLAWARGEEADPSCFELTHGVTVARGDIFVVSRANQSSHGGSALALPVESFSK